ncbi:unnamed protein product [Phytomonas sp. Hart1]|nr:unnamed protein product [Phytomonas sp. Hart1]|eukprot:CCW66705.1 unnamed protein product [Phytomonas sp. isolate Hart1]
MGELSTNGEGLARQDLSKLDVSKLGVDTLEVMSRQATVNVGTIGHVAHGKSTVVKALTGVRTQKYHREAVMNITIHLGYANAKVFQCETCPRPTCFQTCPSSQPDDTPCPQCGKSMVLKRHFSFVDCPGHDALMATMLSGAAIMDAALLLIAANESFPQPQTLEHIAAAEIMGGCFLIVLQNKMDLIRNPELATEQRDLIQHYLDTKTNYVGAPILPISAQLEINIPYLLEYLVHVPLPKRMMRTPDVRLHVLQSFDLSISGDTLETAALCGGVVGGSIKQGVLCKGDVVEFIPGLITVSRPGMPLPSRDAALSGASISYLSTPPPGTLYCTPLRTTVRSLQTENNSLEFAIPGGLIAMGTSLDPALTRQNKLCGQVLRVVHSQLYGDCSNAVDVEVYREVDIHFYLLKELLGLAGPVTRAQHARHGVNSAVRLHTAHHPPGEKIASTRIQPLREGETILISVGTLTTAATVLRTSRAAGRAFCQLERPVCGNIGDKVVLTRYICRKVRLIGWGTIKRGVPVQFL